MQPYMVSYRLWHATLYGMQQYMACNSIWHPTVYGKLHFSWSLSDIMCSL